MNILRAHVMKETWGTIERKFCDFLKIQIYHVMSKWKRKDIFQTHPTEN